MHKIYLAICLGLIFSMIPPVHAAEDPASETGEACESDEPCTREEDEELERGFDPCLINASLPACQSEEDGGDSGAAELRSPEAEDTDDSG